MLTTDQKALESFNKAWETTGAGACLGMAQTSSTLLDLLRLYHTKAVDRVYVQPCADGDSKSQEHGDGKSSSLSAAEFSSSVWLCMLQFSGILTLRSFTGDERFDSVAHRTGLDRGLAMRAGVSDSTQKSTESFPTLQEG